MYLFAAQLQSKRGMAQEAAAYITKSRDLVSSATGVPFWAWTGVSGVPLGTYFLSSRVESVEQYMATSEAVNQKADYHAQLKASAEIFDGPTEMGLSQIVAMAGEIPEQPKSLAVVTIMTVLAGKQMDAMTWASKMMNHVNELTGVASFYAVNTVGPINEVSILTGFDSGAEVDEFGAKVTSDPGYLEMVGQVGEFLVAGGSRRMMLAQLP